MKLTLSKTVINDLIIEPEIISPAYYRKRLQYPIWPGGESGITIGIGYDLGYHNSLQVFKDWRDILHPEEIARLQRYCGERGAECKELLPIPVKVLFEAALIVFYKTSLVQYAKMAAEVYDELHELHPYEQTAIVGLVYNRGSATKDKPGSDRRKEMRLLIDAVRLDNDTMMAALFRQMKRLWEGKNLGGLLKRVEASAIYIEKPDTDIPEEDKLTIEISTDV